jgi:energy-coupling factor transporter ATP-binding protein EcfA2
MSIDTNPQSAGSDVADTHDLIRVQGARENNLKNVSVELPKRRLTVFTGVSGSGKSSLVFGTIAAESQRMINETYSAFLQGFMPSLARPDVDRLEGLTTAIIVDQERMGANSRSTVGTATDANSMLRILFSRLGQPHIGSPQAFSFNVASISGAGAVSIERGGTTVKERRSFSITGGMCPRCEGMGKVNDIDRTQLYDNSKSLNEGALTIPGYTADGWGVRIFAGSGFLDADKPIRDYTEKELDDFLYREPIKVKVGDINMTYEGLIPKLQKSMLSKDREAMQPHIRAFVDRAVTFTTCPECGGTRLSEGARSSKIAGTSIADACAMQISDLAEWVRGLHEPSVAPLLTALQETLDSFVTIGLGYLSLDRPAGTLSGGEAQRTKMIRHLGSSLTDITYVFDEPTIGLHPHDIQRMNQLLLKLRDKGNTVLVVEDDLDRRPRRRSRTGCGNRWRHHLLRGHRRGSAHERNAHGSPFRRPRDLEGDGAHADRHAADPGCDGEQPAGCRRRHPPRSARRAHGRSRLGQELARARLHPRRRRRGVDRPGRHPGLTTQQPGDLHGAARPDPRGVREDERGEARVVQRQLRGGMPELQRGRGRLHRPRHDGDRVEHVRGVRGQAVRCGRARLPSRRS